MQNKTESFHGSNSVRTTAAASGSFGIIPVLQLPEDSEYSNAQSDAPSPMPNLNVPESDIKKWREWYQNCQKIALRDFDYDYPHKHDPKEWAEEQARLAVVREVPVLLAPVIKEALKKSSLSPNHQEQRAEWVAKQHRIVVVAICGE